MFSERRPYLHPMSMKVYGRMIKLKNVGNVVSKLIAPKRVTAKKKY